jgi:hypothetical protein
MNTRSDFDDQLRAWADLGDERLPSRYLDAALAQIETTRQRGAWWRPLEGILMNLKPAAPFIGIAAVVILAIATYQFIGRPDVGDSNPSPIPSQLNEELLSIVVTDAIAPGGMTVYQTLRGSSALDASGAAPSDSPGFVDAVLTDFDRDDLHVGDHEDRYRTFVAEFETVADAKRAFDAGVANLLSPDGWALTTPADVADLRPEFDRDPALGDESAFYVRGPNEYGFPRLSVYFWRVGNLLLQAVDYHPYDRVGLMASVAEGMDARAAGN